MLEPCQSFILDPLVGKYGINGTYIYITNRVCVGPEEHPYPFMQKEKKKHCRTILTF